MKAKALLFIVIIDVLTVSSNAAIFGVIAGYCACQAACNAAWVTCLAGLGLVAGISFNYSEFEKIIFSFI